LKGDNYFALEKLPVKKIILNALERDEHYHYFEMMMMIREACFEFEHCKFCL
jgi:hypothetical protein